MLCVFTQYNLRGWFYVIIITTRFSWNVHAVIKSITKYKALHCQCLGKKQFLFSIRVVLWWEIFIKFWRFVHYCKRLPRKIQKSIVHRNAVCKLTQKWNSPNIRRRWLTHGKSLAETSYTGGWDTENFLLWYDPKDIFLILKSIAINN